MRGTRSLAALAVLVLAQVTGCGSCVKDEPAVIEDGGRTKPFPLKGAQKGLSNFAESGAEDAATKD
jgi:hypothetical protein